LKNIGGMPAPVEIAYTLKYGTTGKSHVSPEVWLKDLTSTTIQLKDVKDVTKLNIEGGIFMDADTSNNSWISKK
tara:strand:- start:2605 stop:2826 length:222 start_codon:yes stop_codon:yes gene_type:complete